jgi:hypothetical protein
MTPAPTTGSYDFQYHAVIADFFHGYDLALALPHRWQALPFHFSSLHRAQIFSDRETRVGLRFDILDAHSRGDLLQ